MGDSRAVVFQEGSFCGLNNLHDFSNEKERKAVEQRGGTLFNNRLEGELALSRSVGDINFKAYMSNEPEVSVYEMRREDRYLVLGSDGFWNVSSKFLILKSKQRFNRD